MTDACTCTVCIQKLNMNCINLNEIYLPMNSLYGDVTKIQPILS